MSEVYIVTGKLGDGKTLVCVGKIREYLAQGRRVATNLDINLSQMFSQKSKTKNLIRLPDKPTLYDFECLGRAYSGAYDESKSGLIVLDEAGTWLNSRDWQEKGRRELLNHLLHIRKLGWSVYFVIQDISMLDKQFRKALAQYVVRARRIDKIKIPFLTFIFKLFLVDLRLPRMHIASVRLGDLPNSLKVDTWYYRGSELYSAYDTQQYFSDDYESSTYSVLPPIYFKSANKTTWSVKNIMRLTHVYFRKYSRILVFFCGAGLVTMINLYSNTKSTTATDVKVQHQKEQIIESNEVEESTESVSKVDASNYAIVGHIKTAKEHIYMLINTLTKEQLTTRDLILRGYSYTAFDKCKIVLRKSGESNEVYCALTQHSINNDNEVLALSAADATLLQ